MKKRVLALALAVLLATAGCAPSGAEPPSTPTPTPAATPFPTATPLPAAERVFALACYPEDSLHPITGSNRTNLLLAPLVYQGLFALDESFVPHKQLCADYAVSEDGLTWTFTLTEAVFSDGSPLTAAEAASSLKLAAKSTLYGARFANVSRIIADREVLVLALSSPNGNLPALLDVPIVKDAEEGLPPYGTGAYAFAADDGGGWSLERTGLSAGGSLPTRIPLHSIRQTDELIQSFDAGRVSLVASDPAGTGALGFSGSFEVWDYPTATMLYIGFNTAKGPCADEKVRQALLYGFDRSTVAASLLSRHAEAAVLPVPPASPLYDAALAASLGYSHQTMADLLDGAGWTLADGVRVNKKETLSLVFLVNMENSAKLSIAEFLAQGLERSGISVTLKKLSWEDYTAALAKGNFDLYLAETRLTADFDLSPLAASGGALNYGRCKDEETDALLERFRSAGELDRPAAASDLYVRLSTTVPFVPLCFKNGTVLTSWGSLSGLSPTQQNAFFRFDQWRF